MHGSGNVVFVAEVNADLVGSVEAALIWEHRELLSYNRVGMRFPPAFPLTLVHEGEAPAFVG